MESRSQKATTSFLQAPDVPPALVCAGRDDQVLVKYRQRPGSLTDDPRRQKWSAAEINAFAASIGD